MSLHVVEQPHSKKTSLNYMTKNTPKSECDIRHIMYLRNKVLLSFDSFYGISKHSIEDWKRSSQSTPKVIALAWLGCSGKENVKRSCALVFREVEQHSIAVHFHCRRFPCHFPSPIDALESTFNHGFEISFVASFDKCNQHSR